MRRATVYSVDRPTTYTAYTTCPYCRQLVKFKLKNKPVSGDTYTCTEWRNVFGDHMHIYGHLNSDRAFKVSYPPIELAAERYR